MVGPSLVLKPTLAGDQYGRNFINILEREVETLKGVCLLWNSISVLCKALET